MMIDLSHATEHHRVVVADLAFLNRARVESTFYEDLREKLQDSWIKNLEKCEKTMSGYKPDMILTSTAFWFVFEERS